jgi:hypothetical protein
MAAGGVVAKARAGGTAAVATQEIRGDAALIEKDVVPPIAQRLPLVPVPAGGGDVRPALFVGVYGFF